MGKVLLKQRVMAGILTALCMFSCVDILVGEPFFFTRIFIAIIMGIMAVIAGDKITR